MISTATLTSSAAIFRLATRRLHRCLRYVPGILCAAMLPVVTSAQSPSPAPPPPSDVISQISAPLPPYIARYQATHRMGISFAGAAERTLIQLHDDIWEYQFSARAWPATRDERVTFRWQDNQLIPLSYQYRIYGWGVKDRSASLTFDWPRQRVRNDVQSKPWWLTVPPGALDNLGYQLQLRIDLMLGKRQMNYQIADGGLLKERTFKVTGEEVLQDEFSGIATVVVEPEEPIGGQNVRLWFARDLDYLLVKMVNIQEGKEQFEILLTDFGSPDRE